MADETGATVKATPDPSEQIRSWLPDHTHVSTPGLLGATGATTWTWTTRQGVWVVTSYRQFFGRSVIALNGPGGNVTCSEPDVETSLRRLHGVLIALDAIEVSS